VDTRALESAIASTRTVLANVSPDQYDAPTPCASWDVRALVNHIVSGLYFFAEAAATGRPPTPADGSGTGTGAVVDYTEGDVLASYDQGAAAAIAAFSAPGAMDRMIELPSAAMPGSAFIGLAATDQFAHGWDLARATGQGTGLASDLADRLLGNAKQTLPDALRGDDGRAPFGPVQETGPDASPADRLAAFLGRRV
jgi:uncharacterized protein (TIGR03086 family)